MKNLNNFRYIYINEKEKIYFSGHINNVSYYDIEGKKVLLSLGGEPPLLDEHIWENAYNSAPTHARYYKQKTKSKHSEH